MAMACVMPGAAPCYGHHPAPPAAPAVLPWRMMASPRHLSAGAPAAALGGGGSGGAGSSGGSGRTGGAGQGGCGDQGPGPSGSSCAARAAALAAAGGVLLLGEGAAWAKKEPHPKPKPQDNALTLDNATDIMYNMLAPMATNLGFSGCMGFAAGLALKKLGQAMAVVVGLLFLMVQGLSYAGFITVNWSHVHKTLLSALDFNKDGKVDGHDFKPLIKQGLAAMVGQGMPSAAGFLTGFLVGAAV